MVMARKRCKRVPERRWRRAIDAVAGETASLDPFLADSHPARILCSMNWKLADRVTVVEKNRLLNSSLL